MDSNYLSILVHPKYKTALQYNAATQTLQDGVHEDKFAVKDNVPVLLTDDPSTDTPGENTDYKAHYQQDAEDYDYFAAISDPIEREEVNRLHQHILAQIPAQANWILDVGCGGGWLAKALQQRSKHVVSMDISDINPRKAVRNVPYPTHYGLVADVYELPIKDGSVDCIVAAEIIEHVNNPAKFIAALYRALKPGGKLIVTTPYNEQIKQSLCIHCNQLTPHNAHIHSFTEEAIMALMPNNVAKQTKVFNNKLVVKTRLQLLMKFLPLGVWNIVDSMGNAMSKKAFRLMLTVTK